MGSIATRLPNLIGVTQTSSSIESGVSGVASLNLFAGGAGSPLAPITDLLSGVSSRLNIDVSGLTDRFPQALDTVRNAVGAGTMDYVGSLNVQFDDTVQFIGDTPLARAARTGSLNDGVLAAITAFLDSFQQSHRDLTRRLIDPDTLGRITELLDAIQRFRTDFAANRGEFLPFISHNLLGVAPDFLDVPMAHVRSARNVLSALDSASLDTAFRVPSTALTGAVRQLETLVQSFDPANAAAYAQIEALLGSLDGASRSMQAAANAFYSTLSGALSAQPFDTVLSTLRTLLDALPLESIPTMDDLTEGIANIVHGILVQLETAVSPQDVAQRIERFANAIRQALEQSPLNEIRRVIREFLAKIREAIESIPTEQIQQAVEGMLERVRMEVESLGLDNIGDTIEQAFQDLESFINSTINDTLRDRVREALQSLLSGLGNLPIATLTTDLSQIVSQVQALMDELEQALQQGFDQISDAVTELDGLSFKPVGDEVVGEIDDVKSRLQAINPNALSDAEKLGIQGAVAILEGIDLDGFVRDQVKTAFAAGKDQLLVVVNEVDTALHTVTDRMAGFDPRLLVSALTNVLNEANRALESLDARALLQALYAQLDEFGRNLEAFSPATLLAPLTQPFEGALAQVNRLDPGVLVEPLRDLYAELDRLLGFIDITPVLDDLDRRQRELYSDLRQTILSSIDSLTLPEPLAGFFANLRPVMEALTSALFDDPDSQLRTVSLDISTRVRLRTLFEPLDSLFSELTSIIESAPSEEIVQAFNAIRTAIGVGPDLLNPHNLLDFFRARLSQLEDIAPRKLFVLPMRLPALKAAFEARAAAAPTGLQGAVAGVNARFEVSLQLFSPTAPESVLREISTMHDALLASLRGSVISMTGASGLGSVEASYARLRDQLDRVLPAFLRSPTPITFADVLEGLNALRPSRKAVELESFINRFLGRLRPMEDALEPAMNSVFASIRQAVLILSPLSIKDAVAEIYTAIREKYRILDPDTLATALRAIFDPVRTAVNAINPATLRARLDSAYQSVVQTLGSALRSLLDEVAAILNGQLRALRDAVTRILDQVNGVVETTAQTFQEIIERIENLVFVEILDRIRQLLDNLNVSFDKEVDRVRNSFREMLNAIPVGGGSASVSVAA